MLSIKEKLRSIDRSSGIAADSFTKKTDVDFESIGLEQHVNACGQFYVRQKQFPFDFMHGNRTLGACLDVSHRHLELINKAHLKNQITLKECLFFDTETTGLAGGSGTYIFLCGFGYFESDKFVVQQILLPDYENESAFLQEIVRIFSQNKAIISFNGKSYDLSLLRARLVLNKMKFDFDNFVHIDLLYASRRLWRNKIQECRLGNIEQKILGFARNNDVPGSKVPKLFFDFLKTGDAQLLLPVLKHNVIDILSMVSIVSRMHEIYQTTLSGETKKEADQVGVLKTHISLDDYVTVAQLIRHNLNNLDATALLEIARYLKSSNRTEEAVPIWEKLLSSTAFAETSYLELAKYYEHKEMNYSKALEVVGRAMKRIELRDEFGKMNNPKLGEDWNHRQKRLLKKFDNLI